MHDFKPLPYQKCFCSRSSRFSTIDCSFCWSYTVTIIFNHYHVSLTLLRVRKWFLLLCTVYSGNNVAVDQVVQQLPGILLHPDGEVRSSGSHRWNHWTGTVARVTWLRIVSSAKPALQQEQRLHGEQITIMSWIKTFPIISLCRWIAQSTGKLSSRIISSQC